MDQAACAWCGATPTLKAGMVAPDGWLVVGPLSEPEEPTRDPSYLCGFDHLMRWASVRIVNPSARMRAVMP